MAVDEWKSVESTLNSLVNLDPSEQFSRILSLSYNNLPCHLKSCFLYLGVFPEDSEIEFKKVIRLWIAEGLIKEVSQKTLEESGEDYLHDLINRSLIMKSGQSTDGKVKTGKMHDLLHDLCASKAKKEKLLCIRDSSEHRGNVVHSDGNRWLSLKIVSQPSYLGITLNKSHSILCFDMRAWNIPEWYLLISYVKMRANSFKMLRVLDLTALDCDGSIPSDIVLLRYLALASNRLLTSIPVWRNWILQTLIICEDINGVRKLPHGIWDLPQLRHLELYHQLSMYTPKVVQVTLQTMYWLQCLQCTEQVFSRIPNVKELGIIAQGHRCLDNLNCLNKLEKLKVRGTYCPIKLPTHADAFPQNLKKITLAKTLMPWEAMNVISVLPDLEVLKLKNHTCLGQEWELTKEDGFRRLKLLLISVTDLKHWKAANDVDSPFPVLERLVLRNCFELKEMPSWIEAINNLKSIQLEHCYACLVESAKKIQENKIDLCGEECAFEILEFHTQSEDLAEKDEDQNNSEREDQKSNDAEEIDEQKYEEDIKMSVLISLKQEVSTPQTEQSWVLDLDLGLRVCNLSILSSNLTSVKELYTVPLCYNVCRYEVVKLQDVFWLEITGMVDTRYLLKMTCYSAYFAFKLKQITRKLDAALTSVRYLKDEESYGENRRSRVFLAKTRSSGDPGQFPDCRHDGWMEIKFGDFYISSGNEGEVEMRLLNTKSTWKFGLIVRGIEVRPY